VNLCEDLCVSMVRKKSRQRLVKETQAYDLLSRLTNGLSLIQNRQGFLIHSSA
jgi:hypothetical protein